MHLFFQNALLVLRQLVGIYLIVGMGIAAERLKWFPAATAKLCTQLLLYVVTPCVIVNSFLQMEYSAAQLRNLGIAAFGGALIFSSGILIAWRLYRGKKHPDTDPILHYASIYGNCGFMGLPLARAIVGDIGVFYVSIVVIVFQLLAFTHGMWVMNGGAVSNEAAGPKSQEVRFSAKSLLLNPGLISVSIGLPLYMLSVPVPALLAEPVRTVAAMNTPFAMLIFGTYLSRTRLNSVLRNKKIFLAASIKMLAAPAVLMTTLLLLGIRGPLLHALLIPASTPCANNTAVFAAKFDRDAGYGAQVVALFSIISVFTMPMILAVAMSL